MHQPEIARADSARLRTRLAFLRRVIAQEPTPALKAEQQEIIQELDWRRVEDSYEAYIARQAAGGGLWA